MNAGYVQKRRAILQHLQEGRMSMREYAVYDVLLLADKATGLWWGCSIALAAHFGTGEIGDRPAQDVLRSLEQKGYIKSFRKQGQRGNQPILIDKYLVSYGGVRGKRVNAAKTMSYDNIVYEDGDEGSGDIGGEPSGDTRALSIPLKVKPENVMVSYEAAPANVNGSNSETQAESIVDYIYKNILEGKESPSEKTMTVSFEKTLEALKTRSYERLKACLDYARKTKFWYAALGTADFPVSFFLSSVPRIEEQMQEAGKKAARKAHVENKAAQMGAKPKTASSVAAPVFSLGRVFSLRHAQIKERRADLFIRNMNIANAEIRTVEDSTLVGLLRTAAINNPMTDIPGAVFQYRHQHRENPAHILISHEDTPLLCHDYIDRETKRKLLKAGVVGYFQGATIIRTRCLSKGEMFVLPAAERLGSLLEKDALTVKIDRDLRRREYLFRLHEAIGMVLSNPRVSRYAGVQS